VVTDLLRNLCADEVVSYLQSRRGSFRPGTAKKREGYGCVVALPARGPLASGIRLLTWYVQDPQEVYHWPNQAHRRWRFHCRDLPSEPRCHGRHKLHPGPHHSPLLQPSRRHAGRQERGRIAGRARDVRGGAKVASRLRAQLPKSVSWNGPGSYKRWLRLAG
jgi:hypothetical protein